jgi:hypothetical protein
MFQDPTEKAYFNLKPCPENSKINIECNALKTTLPWAFGKVKG